MPVHLYILHIKMQIRSREGKLKGKGGGSKVGTLETLTRLHMKLNGQYPPDTPGKRVVVGILCIKPA